MKGLGAAGAVLSTAVAVLAFGLTLAAYPRYFALQVQGRLPADMASFFGDYGDAFALSLILGALAASLTLVAIVLASGIRLAVQWPMRVEPRALAAWLLVTVGLFAVLVPLAAWLGDERGAEVFRQAYRSASAKWLVVAAVAVAAPLVEELAVRGVLLPGLARTRLRERGAIAVTALAWALAHGARHPAALAAIFASGIFLGMARLRTGSVAVPMAMHMAWNGALCVAMAYG